MKISILVILVCIANFVSSQSQSQKGNFMLGSHFLNLRTLDWSHENSYYSDTTIINKVTANINNYSFGLNLWITGAYFLKDNLAIGFGFGKSHPDGVGVQLVPFARWYLRQKKSCFSFNKADKPTNRRALFSEVNLSGNYSISNNNVLKIKDIYYGFSGNAGIGYTYLLSKYIATEGLIMYNLTYNREIVHGNKSYFGNKRYGGGLNIFLGIQFYF